MSSVCKVPAVVRMSSVCNVPAVVRRYESVPEYAAEMAKLPDGVVRNRAGSPSWDGGVNSEEALKRCVKGDPELVTSVTDAIHKVSASAMATDLRDRYVPAMAGSRVSVPDYLGGSPTCMRRRAKVETACRSVCIYCSTTCSAGITADMMIKRGSSILGLLEFLQGSQISVDLYLLAETEGSVAERNDLFQVIRVESRPLDLSTAAFAIAHPAFARSVTYLAPDALGWGGGWPTSMNQLGGFGSTEGQSDKYHQHLREVLGMNEGDLLIPGACSWDEIITEPEQWLAARIKQLGLGPA